MRPLDAPAALCLAHDQTPTLCWGAGAIATAGVLILGLVAFQKVQTCGLIPLATAEPAADTSGVQGNQQVSQQMMRTRVLFQVGVGLHVVAPCVQALEHGAVLQGATVAIMVGSSGYYATTAAKQ